MSEWKVITGDCLEALRSMPDASVDAIVTDPPWNCGYFGASDAESWGEYKIRLSGWVRECERVAPGQVWFQSTKGIQHVSDVFAEYQPFASTKNFSQMTGKTLPNCWDIAWIKDGSEAYKGNGRNWFLCNTAGMLADRTDHPTPRTVDVMRYVIDMFDWQTICDPFCGSGTTGVACIQTGRNFIGIEIDPGYAEIARRRIGEAANHLFREPARSPETQGVLIG